MLKRGPARIWSKLDIRSFFDCWSWKGYTDNGGYGNVWWNGRSRKAHRVVWQLVYGKIPIGKHILHHCDNRLCCNPSHLFIGTNQDNVDDKMAKGREPHMVGESNGNSRLTEQAVKEMRYLSAEESYSQYQLAKKFGVSQPTTWQILNRITWKHV